MKNTLLLLALHCLSLWLGAQAAGPTLVLAGDYADPSVVKIGDTYWATATSSNWFPAYPLLKSKDLLHWEQQGYVFEQRPEWADYYFWAPEISHENGKTYIYYSAHREGGNLCVATAVADRPEGPYTDLGPLICQEVGSIDGFPMRDENGKLYLIWKEDGNSVNRPTPIWAAEMKEDRTGLAGEKQELFRNDQPWEGHLVEGVAMIRHGDYFYAFYAARGCCGRGCDYVTGVARARQLLGPWEKYDRNPILSGGDSWACPGHGTAVEKDGRYFFLYHAYDKEGNVYTGRQGLLQEFRFTADGWVEFLSGQAAPADAKAASGNQEQVDEFSGDSLSDQWQWSVFEAPNYELNNGKLLLKASPDKAGAFLGRRAPAADFTAETTVLARRSPAGAGLALIGDQDNLIGLTVEDSAIRLWKVERDTLVSILEQPIRRKKRVQLQVQVRNGHELSFAYRLGRRAFRTLNDQPISGHFLPPWDRAVRIGVVAKGDQEEQGVFEWFHLRF